MWELDHRKGWVLKNWCFRIVVLEKTLESPLDSKAIKPINPKGNQHWILIRRTDVEAEASIFCHLMWKVNSLEKTLMLGKTESDRGWDGWIASLIQWTWTWANSRRWWGIARPGVLQSMGSQRVKHSLVTQQQQQIINQTYTCVLAKSLQSCLTLCNSMYYSPPGSSVHGDAPGKNAGVGCHALLQEPNLSGWCHYFFIVTKYI